MTNMEISRTAYSEISAWFFKACNSCSKDIFLPIRSTNVHVGDVTPRISFIFTVSTPNNGTNVTDFVPKSQVEDAIR